MESYFGNNGLTFAHSLRTDKEQEKIMLKMPLDGNFTSAINKFKKQGICKYMAMTKPGDIIYQDKSRTVLELVTETMRLLGSFFGHM